MSCRKIRRFRKQATWPKKNDKADWLEFDKKLNYFSNVNLKEITFNTTAHDISTFLRKESLLV